MLTLEERFWSKVDKNGPTMPHMDTECWVWTGAHNAKGYGFIRVGGRTSHAHRVAMKLQGIPLDDDELGCHRCDNPPCQRGEHLFAGTHKTNAEDKVRKGRARTRFSGVTHCKSEHEFDAANTYVTTAGRHCRKCRAINSQKARDKQKAKAS